MLNNQHTLRSDHSTATRHRVQWYTRLKGAFVLFLETNSHFAIKLHVQQHTILRSAIRLTLNNVWKGLDDYSKYTVILKLLPGLQNRYKVAYLVCRTITFDQRFGVRFLSMDEWVNLIVLSVYKNVGDLQVCQTLEYSLYRYIRF